MTEEKKEYPYQIEDINGKKYMIHQVDPKEKTFRVEKCNLQPRQPMQPVKKPQL
jgi:hypothetical protein